MRAHVKRYLLRRAGNMVLVLLGLTLLVFALLRLAPGNPVDTLLGEDATPELRAEMERKLGMDRSLPVQYLRYVGNFLQGDFGRSIRFSQPALSLVLERFPATLELALSAALLVVTFSIPIGVLVALRRQTWLDYLGTVSTLLGVSMPGFWLGMMLILIFAVHLGWMASSGRGAPLPVSLGALLFQADPAPLIGTLRALGMPAVTLAAFGMAFLTRLTRGNVLEELSRSYVRAALARGLPFSLVVAKHALRNALMPVVTVLGLELGTLVGGAIIIETLYAWPGIGQLIFQAVSARDYPLAQTGILFVGSLVVCFTLAVDIAYSWLDPRIRYG